MHVVHVHGMVRIVMAYGTSSRRTGHAMMMSEVACHRANSRPFQTTASKHG